MAATCPKTGWSNFLRMTSTFCFQKKHMKECILSSDEHADTFGGTFSQHRPSGISLCLHLRVFSIMAGRYDNEASTKHRCVMLKSALLSDTEM